MPKVKLCFYSHMETEVADFHKWTPVAEKVVKFLNSDLKSEYPKAFYFLQTRVKGNATIYAGSWENESYTNDPEFTKILSDYEPPNMSRAHQGKRRKGT